MEVGQGPNAGCGAIRKKKTDADKAVASLSGKDLDQISQLCSIKQTCNLLIITQLMVLQCRSR
jgi:hypothetical protein